MPGFGEQVVGMLKQLHPFSLRSYEKSANYRQKFGKNRNTGVSAPSHKSHGLYCLPQIPPQEKISLNS